MSANSVLRKYKQAFLLEVHTNAVAIIEALRNFKMYLLVEVFNKTVNKEELPLKVVRWIMFLD